MYCDFCGFDLCENLCPNCGAMYLDDVHWVDEPTLDSDLMRRLFSNVGLDILLFEDLGEIDEDTDFTPYNVELVTLDMNCAIIREIDVPMLWNKLRYVSDNCVNECIVWVQFPLVKDMKDSLLIKGWKNCRWLATQNSFEMMAEDIGFIVCTTLKNIVMLQKRMLT